MGPSLAASSHGAHPVTEVSWNDAQRFLGRLSRCLQVVGPTANRSRMGIRMPSRIIRSLRERRRRDRLGSSGMVCGQQRRRDASGGERRRMPGACTICTEMSSSGARTGTGRTHPESDGSCRTVVRHKRILRGGCFSVRHLIAVQPTATALLRTGEATNSAFAWYWVRKRRDENHG